MKKETIYETIFSALFAGIILFLLVTKLSFLGFSMMDTVVEFFGIYALVGISTLVISLEIYLSGKNVLKISDLEASEHEATLEFKKLIKRLAILFSVSVLFLLFFSKNIAQLPVDDEVFAVVVYIFMSSIFLFRHLLFTKYYQQPTV